MESRGPAALPIHRIPVPTPFPVGPVNAYLIDAVPLTLVDSGPKTDEAWAALRQGVEAVGHRIEEIRRLVLSHPHHDHAGLAQTIQKVSGCSVYAHSTDQRRLMGASGEWDRIVAFVLEACRRAGVPGRYVVALEVGFRVMGQYGEPIDAVEGLDEGDRVAFSDTALAVLHTPGHAPGALSYWQPEGRVLFSGDTLLPNISSNAIIEPDPARFRRRTLLEYIATLKRLASLSVGWVLPGHGEEMGGSGDVLSPLVAKRLALYERRASEILELVRQGMGRPWDLVEKLFPDLDPPHVFLGVSEVVGHLDLLADRGQVRFEGQDGPWRVEPV
jgi:glyoxylase-like metal-dependent hydrolase (beta-lactamase superfamily II)